MNKNYKKFVNKHLVEGHKNLKIINTYGRYISFTIDWHLGKAKIIFDTINNCEAVSLLSLLLQQRDIYTTLTNHNTHYWGDIPEEIFDECFNDLSKADKLFKDTIIEWIMK